MTARTTTSSDSKWEDLPARFIVKNADFSMHSKVLKELGATSEEDVLTALFSLMKAFKAEVEERGARLQVHKKLKCLLVSPTRSRIGAVSQWRPVREETLRSWVETYNAEVDEEAENIDF